MTNEGIDSFEKLTSNRVEVSLIAMADNETSSAANEASTQLVDALNIVWIIGICVSFGGLLLQISMYILLPKSRKLDQKILTQLTVTRLINTICEYIVSNALTLHPIARDSIFALYLQSDSVLICWMFLFTKNLHDKVILVFSLQKYNFGLISVLIWCVTLPVGAVCPYLLYNQYYETFKTFYKVYSICKLIVLVVNILYVCRVYSVALNRGRQCKRNLKNIIRLLVVSLTLMCITSLQVLVTDLLSNLYDNSIVSLVFCVINSYQVVAITIIFIGLVKSGSEEPLLRSVAVKAAAKWPGCLGK